MRRKFHGIVEDTQSRYDTTMGGSFKLAMGFYGQQIGEDDQKKKRRKKRRLDS